MVIITCKFKQTKNEFVFLTVLLSRDKLSGVQPLDNTVLRFFRSFLLAACTILPTMPEELELRSPSAEKFNLKEIVEKQN